jgi:putative hydrolase of the HAD superfamily
MTRAITTALVDLDNTLHDYNRAAAIAREKLVQAIAEAAGIDAEGALASYQRATAETADIAPSGFEARRRRLTRLSQILNKPLPVDRLVVTLETSLIESVSPFPGALAALEELAQNYRIIIMTEGYPDIQNAVATKLGLGLRRWPLFASFGHGKRKADGSAYEAIIAHYALNPHESAMIGDNWDWDVLAAARHGLAQIWISHGRARAGEAPQHFLGEAAEFRLAKPLLDSNSRKTPALPANYLAALEETEPDSVSAARIEALGAAILEIVRSVALEPTFARQWGVVRVMNSGSTSRGTYLGQLVDFDPVIETSVPASQFDPQAMGDAAEKIARAAEKHPAFASYLKQAGIAPSTLILAGIGIRGKESFVARYEVETGTGRHNLLDITFGKLPQLTGYEIWFQRFLKNLAPEARARLAREIRLAKKIIKTMPGLYGSAHGGFRAHLVEQWIIQSANYRKGGATLDNALRVLAEEAPQRSFAEYKTLFPVWHPGWWEKETGLDPAAPGVNLFDLLGNGNSTEAEREIWPRFVALGLAHVSLIESGAWSFDALITGALRQG